MISEKQIGLTGVLYLFFILVRIEIIRLFWKGVIFREK